MNIRRVRVPASMKLNLIPPTPRQKGMVLPPQKVVEGRQWQGEVCSLGRATDPTSCAGSSHSYCQLPTTSPLAQTWNHSSTLGTSQVQLQHQLSLLGHLGDIYHYSNNQQKIFLINLIFLFVQQQLVNKFLYVCYQYVVVRNMREVRLTKHLMAGIELTITDKRIFALIHNHQFL